MKVNIIEGTCTLLSSLSHIGETHSVTSMLRREKILTSIGDIEEIPIFSGNAMRGILRDAGMIDMLERLGFTQDLGISLDAYYFLLSGGALTSSANAIDVDKARQWRELIPLVSLFGGGVGNAILPGKLKVSKLYPICEELKHLIPKNYTENINLISIWELIQQESYTRRDDAKDDNKRKYLSTETVLLLESQDIEKRRKQKAKEDIATDEHKQQMRYFCETIAAGTQFYLSFELFDVSDIEFEAFIATLIAFSKMPYIGGKSAIGHGKIKLDLGNWIEINPFKRSGEEVDKIIGQKYIEHLQNNAESIRDILNELSKS